MFEIRLKKLFVNPCIPCEHNHACAHCNHKTEDMELKHPQPPSKKGSKYVDGKLVVASGEDAHAFS
jgi:hypothetical protein